MKSESELAEYKNIKSDFSDHASFEVDVNRRLVERDAFINNLEYTPNYKYPRLDFLIDNADVLEKKKDIYEAVLQLDASKKYSKSDIAETELYACFHEKSLKKILLVEAARNLCNPISMGTLETNRQSFAKLNEALYGEFNNSYYLGMIATEKDRVSSFEPKSEISAKIKSQLEEFLGKIDVCSEKEETLLDKSEIQKLHNYASKRYANVLGVVPNTSDDVYYNVDECVEIMNNALEAGGLSEQGWKVIENPTKTIPTTLTSKKTISLPSSTRRTAAELRRLIIHEQETHARRAKNGQESGLKPLKTGTSNYVGIEEGLGVILECTVDGNFDNPSFDRARNRYITAGLALGVDGHLRDAREVYEALWRMISIKEAGNDDIDKDIISKAKEKAYTHVENAYRGTQFWMEGVIYTKLKIYYEGLVRNVEYFKQNIDNLDATFEDAFIGKYNHTDPEEVNLIKTMIVHE